MRQSSPEPYYFCSPCSASTIREENERGNGKERNRTVIIFRWYNCLYKRANRSMSKLLDIISKFPKVNYISTLFE